jgi:hypothetical protein
MRLVTLLLCVAWLQTCGPPALPPVAAAPAEPELIPVDLASDDVVVLAAALSNTGTAQPEELRRNDARLSAPITSLPQVVVADRTLRLCETTERPNIECIPDSDVHRWTPELTARRIRRTFRIRGTLGAGVILTPAERIFELLENRRFGGVGGPAFRDIFPAPRYSGPVLLSAPVYRAPGVAVVYVLNWTYSGSWIELKRTGNTWRFHRSLGGWQS